MCKFKKESMESSMEEGEVVKKTFDSDIVADLVWLPFFFMFLSWNTGLTDSNENLHPLLIHWWTAWFSDVLTFWLTKQMAPFYQFMCAN